MQFHENVVTLKIIVFDQLAWKKLLRPTDTLQCYEFKSWVHYGCTEPPTHMLVSLENSQGRFSCKCCVEILNIFSTKMKQISSSKNSSDNSSKVDKEEHIETL